MVTYLLLYVQGNLGAERGRPIRPEFRGRLCVLELLSWLRVGEPVFEDNGSHEFVICRMAQQGVCAGSERKCVRFARVVDPDLAYREHLSGG